MMEDLKKNILRFLKHNPFSRFLRSIRFSGLQNFSVYDLVVLYGLGLSKGILSTRAAAVSWNLFFSLFPFLFFLFGLLPELPFYNELEELFFTNIISDLLPPNISAEFNETISTILRNREEDESRRSISWFGVFLTLFLSSNGMYALLIGFSQSYHAQNLKMTMWKQRLIAFLLPIIFALLIVVQLGLFYYSKFLMPYFESTATTSKLYATFSHYLSDLSAFVLYFVSLFILYYFGSFGQQRMRNIFPGAFVTTVLFSGLLFAFSYYVQNYNNYHVFYGSLGVVMVVMLFIYLNVTLVLIGYELNIMLQTVRNGEDIRDDFLEGKEFKSLD